MSVNNLFECAGCRKTEWKQKGFQGWVYKKWDGGELCCNCTNNQNLIDSKCFNCRKDLNINPMYLHQHTFPRKSGNEWGTIWESSYCVDCVPNLDERISGCTNRERIECRGDIRERDSNHSKNHNICALKNCGKIITHKGGKGVTCLDCDRRFCSHECIDRAPKCEQQLAKEHNHNHEPKNSDIWQEMNTEEIEDMLFDKPNHNHHDKESFIGVCDKCNIYYKDTNCWYYVSPKYEEIKSGEKIKINNFCLNCWKTEEKHYRHIANRSHNVYKLDRREQPKLNGEHYYFENNQWISKESRENDPDLAENTNDNRVEGREIKAPTPREQKAFGNLLNHFPNSTIKRITLTNEGSLVVEYNLLDQLLDSGKKITDHSTWVKKNSEEVASNPELILVKSYLQTNNKPSINQQELNSLLNNSQISPESPSNNNPGLGLALGIGGVLLIGIFAYLAIKKNRKIKH